MSLRICGTRLDIRPHVWGGFLELLVGLWLEAQGSRLTMNNDNGVFVWEGA